MQRGKLRHTNADPNNFPIAADGGAAAHTGDDGSVRKEPLHTRFWTQTYDQPRSQDARIPETEIRKAADSDVIHLLCL